MSSVGSGAGVSGSAPGRRDGGRPRRRVPDVAGALLASLLMVGPAPGARGAAPDLETIQDPTVAGERPAAEHPEDPLKPMVMRISEALRRLEVGGVTRDPRGLEPVSEVIRLSVVPQLLGFAEMYRARPLPTLREDVIDRADFLLAHMPSIQNGSAVDGMLGYALLTAHEITGDVRYLNAALPIVARAKALGGALNTLNWGLMSCMLLAKFAEMTGDAAASARTHQIIATLPAYQAANGVFPHVCPGSQDVHYTAWMAMELIVVARHLPSAQGRLLLERAHGFLQTRVGDDGFTVYQDACGPGCFTRYYSRGTGCPGDYDTRAWVNELGYLALTFDHFADPRYARVMGRLRDLEQRGLFGDKWDWFPLPDDPLFAWVGNPSVIRTSVVFWSLAWVLSAREAPWPAHAAAPTVASTLPADELVEPAPAESLYAAWLMTGEVGSGLAPAGPSASAVVPQTARAAAANAAGTDAVAAPGTATVRPNPVRAGAVIGLRLDGEGGLRIEIYDALGRRVREVADGRFAPGHHEFAWDGRDARGVRAGSGVYLVRVTRGTGVHVTRFAVVH